MALTVTTIPAIVGSLFSDFSVAVSMNGSGSPYWDALYGDFDDRFLEAPAYLAPERTGADTIIGRRVQALYQNWISNLGARWSETNVNGGTLTKTGGVNGTWDTSILSPIHSDNAETFFEARPVSSNYAMSIGLTDNASDPNPSSATYKYAWELGSDEYAVARRAGVALINPIYYEPNDRFRVHKVGDSVRYYKNGELIYEYTETAGYYGLYGVLTARTAGASVSKYVHYKYTEPTQGTLVVSIAGVFPVQPNFSYELNADNITLTSPAEDGSRVHRLKGAAKLSLNLQFNERPFTEYKAIYDFWQTHQKHIPFYYRDLVFNKLYYVTFDSGVRIQPLGPDRISITCVLREV